MKYLPLLLLLLFSDPIRAQEKVDDLYLYDKVSKISSDNVFKTAGYYKLS